MGIFSLDRLGLGGAFVLNDWERLRAGEEEDSRG